MQQTYERHIKTKALRNLLKRDEIAYLMEAHSGISAKLVEEAGFEAIWASGLAISTLFGVRDRNEISWTQVLEIVESMADATRIPILFDGDTGFGDFNNFSRLVKKLNQRGIAGVCIEDKLFPKTNSFIGEHQPLATISDFCSKIAAGQDTKDDDNFFITARTEALVSGQGVSEAVRRAEAYFEAGADAILIHSKSRDGADVLEVMKYLHVPCPIIIVPTIYYNTPTEVFIDAGVSGIIWANHTVRASIAAMRNTINEIFHSQNIVTAESTVESLSELFRLTGEEEFSDLEEKYLRNREPLSKSNHEEAINFSTELRHIS